MTLETLVALGCLPARQREALIDRVVLERPAELVASDMGCSRQAVDGLVKNGLGYLALILRKESNA